MKKYMLIPAWLAWMFMMGIFTEYVISRPMNGWIQIISVIIVLGVTAGLLEYTANFLTKNKKQETND